MERNANGSAKFRLFSEYFLGLKKDRKQLYNSKGNQVVRDLFPIPEDSACETCHHVHSRKIFKGKNGARKASVTCRDCPITSNSSVTAIKEAMCCSVSDHDLDAIAKQLEAIWESRIAKLEKIMEEWVLFGLKRLDDIKAKKKSLVPPTSGTPTLARSPLPIVHANRVDSLSRSSSFSSFHGHNSSKLHAWVRISLVLFSKLISKVQPHAAVAFLLV